MLADTSFIIDLMAGVPAAVAKAAEFEKKGLAVWVGAPTVFELYVGLSLTIRPGEELERIIGVIGSLPQLALDHVAAAEAGVVYGEKRREGVVLDPEDAMIAGIARVNGEAVVTRNLRHFKGIKGVAVETY
ncbi:MAG: PIN domain-containing protein [Candidatus Bathyarchaeota archaeon]|nr:PIN domain-containing protein [Candidatus Bathyarchaeota archaeon]